MAGATNITLREDLWPEMDILGVFELTDDEVYFGIISGHTEQPWALSVPQQDIGVVVFSLTSQINSDFIFVSFLKNLALKHKIYLHTVAQNTIPLWEEHGITGILIDLNKKEGDRYGF
jgi:hypothetical protein